jgi:hypothetical protein
MTWYYDGEEVPYEPATAHEWNELWWFICEVYGSPADAL